MKFAEFERRARRAYEEIPEEYLQGVDGLTVRREAETHPDLPGVYTLGQCVTEEHLSDFGSPETTRSVIALYWGSFQALAERDPEFDWDDEIWETLTHELRHHLESLAGDDALEGVDYAADETFKRDEGRGFDPWYFQQGREIAPGTFAVERDVYVEQVWDAGAFADLGWITFRWDGRRYRLPRPDELGDVHFIAVTGIDVPIDRLEIVLVRRRTWWQEVRHALGTYRPVILESVARAEPVEFGG